MYLRAYEVEKDCSERVREGKQLSLYKIFSLHSVWPNTTPLTFDISNYTVFEQASEIPSQTLLRLAFSPTHASYVFSISQAKYLMDDKSLQNPSILRHGIWRTKFTFRGRGSRRDTATSRVSPYLCYTIDDKEI
jgi:hypothetical protein